MMGKRTGRRCEHCRRTAKLRRSKHGPYLLCRACWDRFGGSSSIVNRDAARRRALGQ